MAKKENLKGHFFKSFRAAELSSHFLSQKHPSLSSFHKAEQQSS